MATTKTPAKAPSAPKSPKAAPAAKPKNPFAEGTSKFADFLKAKKLDARRLLAASHSLEALQRDDRAIKHSKRSVAKSAGEGEAKPKETRKPRSGRPVTRRALASALNGKSLSGPTKTRILRAVNHLLEQKKSDKVDLKALF